MKKGILIIGKQFSGKSRLANLLMANNKSVIINGRNELMKCNFLFGDCNKDTEVIFIDDLDINKNDLLAFTNIIDSISVYKQYHNVFKINPKIIISICLNNCSELNINYLSRFFEIFELKNVLTN
jgi:hypothetical protein